MKNSVPSSVVIFGSVLGASIIVSALIGAAVFYKVRSFDNTLSVTGSATQQVTADTAKWNTSFSRTVTETGLKAGYVTMASDLAAVKQFLKDRGIADSDIIVSPVSVEYVYPYNGEYKPEKEYTLRQGVEISSNDVNKIAEMSKNVQPLVDKGVFFMSYSVEFYYSKLADLRVSLLSAALKDAKARATSLAEASDTEVGGLKSASSGVVQVLSANSTEVSDYGSYDTSKIEKQVMVTVKATFMVE
jgi:hypothetical protein